MKHIPLMRSIPFAVRTAFRDALNKTLELFNYANDAVEQRSVYSLISMFAKCIIAYPPRLVENQDKVANKLLIK